MISPAEPRTSDPAATRYAPIIGPEHPGPHRLASRCEKRSLDARESCRLKTLLYQRRCCLRRACGETSPLRPHHVDVVVIHTFLASSIFRRKPLCQGKKSVYTSRLLLLVIPRKVGSRAVLNHKPRAQRRCLSGQHKRGPTAAHMPKETEKTRGRSTWFTPAS